MSLVFRLSLGESKFRCGYPVAVSVGYNVHCQFPSTSSTALAMLLLVVISQTSFWVLSDSTRSVANVLVRKDSPVPLGFSVMVRVAGNSANDGMVGFAARPGRQPGIMFHEVRVASLAG